MKMSLIPYNEKSKYVQPGEKIKLVSLMPLRDYFVKELLPSLGGFSKSIDIEAVIVGEVMLLLGAPHLNDANTPERPTVRMLLADYFVTDVANYHLTKFQNLAYELLKNIPTDTDNSLNIRFMPGMLMVVKLQ